MSQAAAGPWSVRSLDPDATCKECGGGDTVESPIYGDGLHQPCGRLAEAREALKDAEHKLMEAREGYADRARSWERATGCKHGAMPWEGVGEP